MSTVFHAPRIPKFTDPGQPGSPGGVPGVQAPGGGGGVIVAPGVPAPPKPVFDPEPAWYGIRHEWIDTEGRVWDLSSGSNGVFLQRGGLRGLDFGKMTNYVDSSPALAGQRFRGAIHDPRDVFWPLYMYTDSGSDAWMELDNVWWRGLDPLAFGTWRVSVPGGASRSLRVRHIPGGDIAPEMDYVKFGYNAFGLNFVADQPYWEGPEVQVPWGTASRLPFYPGPPFTISKENAADAAQLNNPGDVPAYVRWYLVGPLDFCTVGVGTRSITYTGRINDGEAVFLDTRPSAQVAYLYNFDRTTNQFGALKANTTPLLGDDPDFEGSRIPRRATTALTINMSSTGGTVISVMNPFYYRGVPYSDSQAGAR